jgi:hypothetical protein
MDRHPTAAASITVANLPQFPENSGYFVPCCNKLPARSFRFLKSGNRGAVRSARGFLNEKGIQNEESINRVGAGHDSAQLDSICR